MTVPAAVAEILGQITRDMFMAQFKTIAAFLAAAGALCLVPALTYRPLAGPQPPAADSGNQAGGKAQKPTQATQKDTADFNKGHEHFLQAEMGNMLPLLHGKQGVSFTSREVILYDDGSAELWTPDQPPRFLPSPEARRANPRSLLLRRLRASGDHFRRRCEALGRGDGALRKELPGQFIRPSSSSRASRVPAVRHRRFAGRVVTIRDTKTLDIVATWEMKGPKRLLGAGLSEDGTLLATLAEDHSVSLWRRTRSRNSPRFFPRPDCSDPSSSTTR